MKLLAVNKLKSRIDYFDFDLGIWMPYANLQKEYDSNTNTHYNGYYTQDGKYTPVSVYDDALDRWINCWNNKIKSYSLMGVEY